MREPEPRRHDDDFDQRFAEIVAGFGDDPLFAADVLAEFDEPAPPGAATPASTLTPAPGTPDGSVTPEASGTPDPSAARGGPAGPGLGEGGSARAESAYGPGGVRPGAPAGVNPPLFSGSIPVWRGATGPTYEEILDDEDDEHFIPAPPAPLPPQEDVHFWAMLLGLVGGPLILLWLVVFQPDVGPWWTWLSLGMCVGGFVLLVLRGPKDSEDDPGNGAVV